MQAAHEWLGSAKKLSVDIFEVNPPLILWIVFHSCVGVRSRMAAVPDYAALGFIGLIATACLSVPPMRLIRQHPVFATDVAKRTEFALLLAAILKYSISPVSFLRSRAHHAHAHTALYCFASCRRWSVRRYLTGR